MLQENPSRQDPEEAKLQRLQRSLIFIPIIGVIPSLWLLLPSAHRLKNPEIQNQQNLARFSLGLTFTWLAMYSLLWLGELQNSGLWGFRLLYLNGLLTSGYFLACLFFAWRVSQGKR
ncbi:MAG: hypothetical protein ACKN9E_03165 [Microcystaceae cyanobacterium]